MEEKGIPNFFITLFTKIFGEKANLVMSIFMFSQSPPGKKLMIDIKEAFDTPEGKELLKELIAMCKEEPNA